ncbi:KpsF/GutQ family sugar-phosphate isomerase [Halalkalibacter alkaliphilus]|uniref:KpsF/GutQ family sugar-phosphate isomerase n=1 Tax=Halalkalibacter alkaliphilus TaxID=2917993 RepID=A0A9X2CTM1_9BACI|nr:KpsF/GutQ family sugar-phosphate isomerase [Halalkalibacter alkaliphilus]MCL7748038.1 KpsF/GutQ family sugar-phosphate isomerase [Halalkalibacter alkaliphilus]
MPNMITSTQVLTDKGYLKSMREVLEKEAQAILDLSDSIGHSMEEAIELILQCEGRVVITGIGKSGIIGRKINATMASTGTPSLFLHPSEGLHGDLGMVTRHDVVIAISNSGESEEVINLIPSIKKIGAKIIGISKNSQSTLGLKSDIVLNIGNVKEACPLGLAPTTSTTVTLALGDALAIALLEARKFQPEDFALYHPAGSLGRKLLLTVNDVVQNTRKNPIVLTGETVKDALFQMTAQGMGAATIVDEQGFMVGILTDGDIRRAFALTDNVLTTKVEDLCNLTPVIIKDGALAAEALELMEDKKVNVLPVVDEMKRPIAMIHLYDLMNLGL